MTQIEQAAQEYQNRQDRTTHPDGKFDKGGRWYPSDEEECSCCLHIRQPSRRWPLSLNKHCRSMAHVANLYGVSDKELRKYNAKKN
jgi:hypothetical protein